MLCWSSLFLVLGVIVVGLELVCVGLLLVFECIVCVILLN